MEWGYGTKEQLYLDISGFVQTSKNQGLGFTFYRDGYGVDVENSNFNSSANFIQTGLNYQLNSKILQNNVQLTYGRTKNNYYGFIPGPILRLIDFPEDPSIVRDNFKFLSDFQMAKINF